MNKVEIPKYVLYKTGLTAQEHNERIIFYEKLNDILMRLYSDGFEDGESDDDFLGMGNSPLNNARDALMDLFGVNNDE